MIAQTWAETSRRLMKHIHKSVLVWLETFLDFYPDLEITFGIFAIRLFFYFRGLPHFHSGHSSATLQARRLDAAKLSLSTALLLCKDVPSLIQK